MISFISQLSDLIAVGAKFILHLIQHFLTFFTFVVRSFGYIGEVLLNLPMFVQIFVIVASGVYVTRFCIGRE